jgi:hypothetical protein
MKKQKPKLPEAYYDPKGGCYWILDNRGRWMTVNETSLSRILKSAGVSPLVQGGKLISPLDSSITKLQTTKNVDYAGPLAGYTAGCYEIQGSRVLVTDSPKLVVPVRGDWTLLESVFKNMLDDADFDQRRYFYGWTKVGFEALRNGQPRAGQALVLAGPGDCGKSLVQNILTQVFGGRSAKPYQCMTGATTFNADLFQAEHLMIEDETAAHDIRARRNLGQQIKNITVNESQRCHAKNRTPVSLLPFWRLTISVNDEPENLMVLPPMDVSIEDKIILLKAVRKPMPWPTETDEQRGKFWAALMAQLPAFLDFLLSWEIPTEIRSQRFGVTHFHHPEILAALDGLAPEHRLLRLIDTGVPFGSNGDRREWRGTAADLESILRNGENGSRQLATELFYFPSACGVYLAKLEKKHPDRVTSRRIHGQTEWTICPLGGVTP